MSDQHEALLCKWQCKGFPPVTILTLVWYLCFVYR